MCFSLANLKNKYQVFRLNALSHRHAAAHGKMEKENDESKVEKIIK
jgi:hypothetical protein